MLIQVLGGYGGESLECRMTCLLINGTIALDAGSLSQALSIERQVRVRSILLSHSHMDHTNSLPFFIENVYGKSDGAIDIHASPATVYAIRKYLFNNDTWPDFTRLPNHLLPAVRFQEFESEVPVVIDGVKLHADPGRPPGPHPRLPDRAGRRGGPLVERHRADAALLGDRQPHAQPEGGLHRHQLRQRAPAGGGRLAPPDAADARSRAAQAEKRVPILLHHLKPPCVQRIKEEVRQLRNPDIEFLEQGKEYKF